MKKSNLDQFRALIENPYYNEILALNYKPLNWVHHDWLREIPLIEKMKELNTPKVQQQVFKLLKLAPFINELFDDPLKRLIFLPQERLQRLASVFGLSCFQAQLALLIEKKTKQALCQQLNLDSIKNLQSRLPFMIAKFPESLVCQLPLVDISTNSIRKLYPYGAHLMAIASDGSLSLWHKYLLRKLPKFDPETVKTATLTNKERDSLRTLIQKIALEFEPECTTLLK